MVESLSPELEEDFSRLREGLERVGGLGEESWVKLRSYAGLLHRWSGRMNLISAEDRDLLASKHIGQALAMVPLIRSLVHATVVDFGSGAGLPGVPLKIALPDSHFFLVESRRRRAHFLREVVRRLGLQRVEVVNRRLEDWEGVPGGADLITARAVRAPASLRALVGAYLAPHGQVLTSLDPGGGEGVFLMRRALGAPGAKGVVALL